MKHVITKIARGVTMLSGVENECRIYLIEGKDAALLIDTGLGTVDISEEAAELTALPVFVVNTHGHGDHSGGNMYFPKVYMHREAEADARDALALNKTVLSPEAVEAIEKKLDGGAFAAEYVDDGFIFDLGDRLVEVISIPGHTPGCIALLDQNSRLLFSGDCAVKSMDILVVVPQALSLSTYLESMKKLSSRASDYDSVCTGHDNSPIPASFIDEITACCEDVLSGKAECEAIVLPPVFGDTNAMRTKGADFALAFRPGKLR